MPANHEDAPSQNPFASPESMVVAGGWKMGEFKISEKRIVGGKEIWLPFLCVKCGDKIGEHDETALRKTKKLSWVHPAILLLVLLNMLIFLIVAIIVKKQCSVTYSLCRDCRAKRRNLWLILWGMILVFASIIAGMIAFQMDPTVPVLTGLVGFVGILIMAFMLNGPLAVYWYSKDTFQLKGACKTFLDRAEVVEPEEPLYTAVLAEDGRMS